jgi:hypothetical protein
MAIDAAHLPYVPPIAVVRPLDESATPSSGNEVPSAADIAALNSRLKAHLDDATSRARQAHVLLWEEMQRYRSAELEIKNSDFVLTDESRAYVEDRIRFEETALTNTKIGLDKAAEFLKTYRNPQTSLGRKIARQEFNATDRIRRLYDERVQHYYFLLSCKARDADAAPVAVVNSPADIDALFA